MKEKFNIIKIVFVFLLFFISFISSNIVFGQGGPGGPDVIIGEGPGVPENGTKREIKMIDNPLGDSDEARDPRKLLGRIIGAVLGIVGSLALAIFVYGGLTWMMSAGNEDKVKKGRDMIVWAVFGLTIIFLSYVLVEFVLGAFIQ